MYLIKFVFLKGCNILGIFFLLKLFWKIDKDWRGSMLDPNITHPFKYFIFLYFGNSCSKLADLWVMLVKETSDRYYQMHNGSVAKICKKSECIYFSFFFIVCTRISASRVSGRHSDTQILKKIHMFLCKLSILYK